MTYLKYFQNGVTVLPGEVPADIQRTGGWLVPRLNLDMVVGIKMPAPIRNRPLAAQPVA